MELPESRLSPCKFSAPQGEIPGSSRRPTPAVRTMTPMPSGMSSCDIAERKVLLLYPIMNSGNKVCRAIRVVLDEGRVPEDHVILINLFSTPKAAKRIVTEFPNLTILTSEINEVAPNHFGERYFGTDRAE